MDRSPRSAGRCTAHRGACKGARLGERCALLCLLQYITTERVHTECYQYFYSSTIWHAEKITKCVMASLSAQIQCVPLAGSPGKCWFYKKNKSTIHLHVIPVMKCGCVFCEFAKRKLATRKD
jgi:hypothetical protein